VGLGSGLQALGSGLPGSGLLGSELRAWAPGVWAGVRCLGSEARSRHSASPSTPQCRAKGGRSKGVSASFWLGAGEDSATYRETTNFGCQALRLVRDHPPASVRNESMSVTRRCLIPFWSSPSVWPGIHPSIRVGSCPRVRTSAHPQRLPNGVG